MLNIPPTVTFFEQVACGTHMRKANPIRTIRSRKDHDWPPVYVRALQGTITTTNNEIEKDVPGHIQEEIKVK